MGAPTAVPWTIICYHWHEKIVLIPRYNDRNQLPLMAHYIGDIFAIIVIDGDHGFSQVEWSDFKEDVNNCGILRWKISEPSLQADYLDLTIQLADGKVRTKTCQKPINLYQYITPNSAHPPWMIQGMITSTIKCYYHQNSSIDDYWKVSMKFYLNMKARG